MKEKVIKIFNSLMPKLGIVLKYSAKKFSEETTYKSMFKAVIVLASVSLVSYQFYVSKVMSVDLEANKLAIEYYVDNGYEISHITDIDCENNESISIVKCHKAEYLHDYIVRSLDALDTMHKFLVFLIKLLSFGMVVSFVLHPILHKPEEIEKK
ncbi:hypothetical protein ACNVJQ_005162 [Vibrio harveyi]